MKDFVIKVSEVDILNSEIDALKIEIEFYQDQKSRLLKNVQNLINDNKILIKIIKENIDPLVLKDTSVLNELSPNTKFMLYDLIKKLNENK